MLDGWGASACLRRCAGRERLCVVAGVGHRAAIVVARAGGGGWVLDGYGGVHPFGGAPAVTATGAWPGVDIARRIVLDDSGTRGWVLDGNGGMHRFAPVGTQLPPSPSNPLAPETSVRGAFSGAGGHRLLHQRPRHRRALRHARRASPTHPGQDGTSPGRSLRPSDTSRRVSSALRQNRTSVVRLSPPSSQGSHHWRRRPARRW